MSDFDLQQALDIVDVTSSGPLPRSWIGLLPVSKWDTGVTAHRGNSRGS